MGYRPTATKTRDLSLWHGVLFTFLRLHPQPARCHHARTSHTWGTEARRSEKTALTVWYRKALVAFHCSRVSQSGPKAAVYQPWSKAAVPVVVYKTESYLSFLQLCTQYNLPHAPLSFLLLSYFVVTLRKRPMKILCCASLHLVNCKIIIIKILKDLKVFLREFKYRTLFI